MGKRITIQHALTVELSWSGSTFVFRLMNGPRYATPKLFMDAYAMNLIEQASIVDLFDRHKTKWLSLCSNRRTIGIRWESSRLRSGAIEADVLTIWPDIPYHDFLIQAKNLRGCKPSEGWESIIEAELDEQRRG